MVQIGLLAKEMFCQVASLKQLEKYKEKINNTAGRNVNFRRALSSERSGCYAWCSQNNVVQYINLESVSFSKMDLKWQRKDGPIIVSHFLQLKSFPLCQTAKILMESLAFSALFC